MIAPNRDDELVFLPLGGSGEIGMNFNAYGYGPPDERKWIVVDCGVLFGRETTSPGVDLIMPDIRFLAEQRRNVIAIIATHAHEGKAVLDRALEGCGDLADAVFGEVRPRCGGCFTHDWGNDTARLALVERILNVLLVGSGGREHALAWALAASPLLTKLWCAPGNAGIAEVADCVPIAAADFDALVAFAKEKKKPGLATK